MAAIQEPLAHFAEYERLAYLLGVADQVCSPHLRRLLDSERDLTRRGAPRYYARNRSQQMTACCGGGRSSISPAAAPPQARLSSKPFCDAWTSAWHIRGKTSVCAALRGSSEPQFTAPRHPAAVQRLPLFRDQVLPASPPGPSPLSRPCARRLLPGCCSGVAFPTGMSLLLRPRPSPPTRPSPWPRRPHSP